MSVNNPFPMSHWPQQSPIKICHSETLLVRFPENHLEIDYRDAPFSGRFTGTGGHRNFELTKPHLGGYRPLVSFGDVKAELVKIHLHTPSEHDLEGKNQDGEIHLIHKIDAPMNGSELLVLGVFFKKSLKSIDEDFFRLWATELQAGNRSKGGTEVRIDARKLLPSIDRWFYYQGSLTTEPYSEIVTWVVFPSPLGISSQDLSKLKKKAHQPERPPQDISRRFVLRNFE